MTIKDDVWIGSGTVMVPAVTVGAGSVVGEGVVVAPFPAPIRATGLRDEHWAWAEAQHSATSVGAL